MYRKKKRLLLVVVIIAVVMAGLFVADIVIFDTVNIPDAAYSEGEDTYVRRETVEHWSRGTITELPAVGKPGSETLGFDPDAIMESGMNPGLGIRQLHEQGITGEGVSIAIIDQPLNLDHVEYADRIRSYEILHSMEGSSMHGAAVTSIAVGRNCGVAPGADVYYISSAFIRLTPVGFVTDVFVLADGIDRVLAINRLLPDDKKSVLYRFPWDMEGH